MIAQAEAVATGGVAPDLNILFDLDVETALRRKAGAGAHDRFESEDPGFYRRVRTGYLLDAGERPDRWLLIDAGVGEEAVTEAMWPQIERRLGPS